MKKDGFASLLAVLVVIIAILGTVGAYVVLSKKSNTPLTQTTNPPALSVTLLSPRGGEKLCIGDSFPIAWSVTGADAFSRVSIGIQSGAGGSIFYIDHVSATYGATSTPENGTYPWVVGSTLETKRALPTRYNLDQGSQYRIILTAIIDEKSGAADPTKSNPYIQASDSNKTPFSLIRCEQKNQVDAAPQPSNTAIAMTELEKRDETKRKRLRQIQAPLELYFNQHGGYPVKLSDASQFLGQYPDAPKTTDGFSYSVAPDKQSYHLGVTLESTSSYGQIGGLGADSDFNSLKAGWQNGFDGADNKPCAVRDKGISCYDLTIP